MNQRTRLLIAMALVLGILMLWQSVFSSRPTEEQKQEQTSEKGRPAEPAKDDHTEMSPATPEETTPPTPEDTTPAPPGETGEPVQPEETPAAPAAMAEDFTFETRYLRAILTTKGAALKSLEILPADGPQYSINLIDYNGEAREQLSLGLTDTDIHVSEEAIYQVLQKTESVIEFTSVWKDGWRLVKTYDFTTREGDSPYAFRLTLRFENRADSPRQVRFTLNGSAGVSMADPFIPQVQAHVLQLKDGGIHVEKQDVAGVFDEPKTYENGNTQYVAVTNKYFAAALIYADEDPPVSDALIKPLLTAKEGGKNDIKENNVVAALCCKADIPSVSSDGKPCVQEMPFIFYAGPRQEEKVNVLARYHMTELEVKMDWPIFGFLFGWFVEPFSKMVIMPVLRGLNSVIGNYGIAILLLTFLLRLVMFPVSKKQQESMQKMQKLAPKMKAIKEKFKGNKQKQSEETMKLYKQHGVNPAAGCLPILLQMPMFLGLFFALRYAVDLRKAGFLYINDLSLPDGLSLGVNIDFTVPFFNWYFPYLNILPLVMMGVWVLQQALAPKAADAQQRQQQKIMMVMPVVFGLLLYNYAAGLALYMIGNMFFGMVEQHIVKKIVAKHLAEAVPPVQTGGRRTAAGKRRA